MYKKIIAALLTLVMVLSSTAFVMAANVTMSITIGTGEQKSLDTYLQAGATNVSWSNSAPGVVKISGNKITGSKVGNAVISGSANGVSYEFKIKVLKNFSGYQDIINQSPSVNDGRNSRGQTIAHVERYITMGVKDKFPLTNMLENGMKYDKYNWRFSDKNIVSIKQGKLTSIKPGIVHITATRDTTVYDFFVTVADNYATKEIKVKRNSLTNLSKYLGDDLTSYVYSVEGLKDSAVGVQDDKFISAGDGKGISLLRAESTTGGTNYNFIVTIIG